MAVYDGFFDAVMDDETGEYDRAYESGDFTGYFSNIIGTGVCVHNDPDSFKVRLEGGKAVVSPGYLFIQGYWLKNDADYPIDLPGTGNYAIAAHLNLGKRMIELEARSVAQAYPDSLVLAIVSPTAAEDTRHNTDICGVIDTAGALSSKVEWAVNYIDTEIDSKLAQVERDINAQAAKLDAKIAEVQAVADSIVPPPVGSIKFSASQDVGEEWLRCDGSFVSEAQYPELVAALGKLIPSGDKFQLISNGEIGPQISNGVVYGGRLWVYSYSTRKLYGIDLDGADAVREITVTSEDENFNNFVPPTNTSPIALSIVPHVSGTGARLFLAQALSEGKIATYPEMAEIFLMYQSEFSGAEDSISVSFPFQEIKPITLSSTEAKYAHVYPNLICPKVVSKSLSGVETYFFVCGGTDTYKNGNLYQPYYGGYVSWTDDGGAKINFSAPNQSLQAVSEQRWSFSPKSKGELIVVDIYTSTAPHKMRIYSYPTGTFDISFDIGSSYGPEMREQKGPVNVIGANKALFAFNTNLFPWASLDDNTTEAPTSNLPLPSAARTFPDAAAYLWGKDIFLIFVGTGIIFSRTLEEGDFGYLDTTSILGTITQFGYLDYDQSEGTLYLLGQDTTNTVKAAKIVLNTLYDYANDGAWLPMIASDGVPAYIKAKDEDIPVVGDALTVTVESPKFAYIDGYAVIEFNGQTLGAGTYQYSYPGGAGNFTASVRAINTTTQAITLRVNGSTMATLPKGSPEGEKKSITLGVSPYMASGLTLILSVT